MAYFSGLWAKKNRGSLYGHQREKEKRIPVVTKRALPADKKIH